MTFCAKIIVENVFICQYNFFSRNNPQKYNVCHFVKIRNFFVNFLKNVKIFLNFIQNLLFDKNKFEIVFLLATLQSGTAAVAIWNYKIA